MPNGSSIVTGHFKDTVIFGGGESNETEISLSSSGDYDVFIAKFQP